MPSARRGATLRDIASEAGLSVAAVSYALRGMQTSVETQERVHKIAERIGYRADPIARALASGQTGTVGLLIGNLADDLWMQRVAAGVGSALLDRGLYAFLVDAGTDADQEQRLAHQLIDQRVDALIVSPVDPGGSGWAELARRVPIVTIGDSLVGAATAGEVLFDNKDGVRKVLEYLAGFGHRRVCLMTAARAPTSGRPAESYAGVEAERLGIALEVVYTGSDLAASAEAIESVLTDAPARRRATAVVGMSDSLAYGCYLAVQRLEWAIPQQLSVVGFDDQPVSAILDPPLTTVGWNERALTEGVGQAVVSAIVAAAKREATASSPTGRASGPATGTTIAGGSVSVSGSRRKRGTRLTLAPELLVRGSVAVAPSGRPSRGARSD